MQAGDDKRGNTLWTAINARGVMFEKYHIPLLLVAVLIADLYGLLHIDNVIESWDGTDLGSIARNYYLNGMRFFYPQVDWGGNGPGYVEMQLPLTSYLTAVLYKLFGFHEQLAIIIPFFSGLGTVLVVYYFARDVHDSFVGLLAGFFVALSPYWAWQSTIFLNDPPTIFCGTLGLYYIYRWTRDEKWTYYFLGAAFIALAILLKIPSLYLGLVVLFLWVLKYKFAVIRDFRFWLFGALTLLPSLLWYYYAHTLYVEYHNSFGILAGGESKFAEISLLLSSDFYFKVFGRVSRYLLTPMVTIFFLYGMTTWGRPGKSNIFRVWTLGVILFQLVAGYGTYQGVQYLIPLFPSSAIVAASGLAALARRLKSIFLKRPLFYGRAMRVATVLCATLLLANYIWALKILPYLTLYKSEYRLIGQEVAKATPPGSLIIVAEPHDSELRVESEGQLSRPPHVFYYSHRKGWYIPMRWFDERYVEDRRSEGATLAVVAIGVADFVSHHPTYNYLSSHYRTIVHNDYSLIYDLRIRK